MKIEELYNASAFDVINKAIADKDEKIILGISTGLIVAMGDGIQANDGYCKSNNIPILPFPNTGGCIVIFPDDIVLAWLTENTTSDFVCRFLQEFTNWLNVQGLNATFTGNDVLIDNTYKVASGSAKAFDNGFAYLPVHISMTVDLDLIKNICNKPMVKIPKGLKDYNFTPEQIADAAKIIIERLVDE